MLKNLLIALVLFCSVAQLSANNTQVVQQFEKHAEKTLKELNIPGAAIAVVSKDKVIFLKSYGVRSLETQQPIDAQTVFRIASITKGFTAELTGIMDERDLLKWDDQVIKYLPNFKLHDSKATQALTLDDVLSQRTGLPERANDDLIETDKSYHEVLYSLDKIPLTCSVGACYAYQNVTFSMMGNILEKVTKKNYSDLVKENIFKPLNMQNASTSYAELLASNNYADCHTLNVNGTFSTCPISQFGYFILPAGGMNASLNDLTIWLRAQMGNYPQVISSNILKAVQTPQITIPPKDLDKPYAPWQKARLRSSAYGMGWRIDDYAGTPMIFHSGTLTGASAAIGFLPEHEIGVIVLVNTHNYPASILMAQFFDLYLNIPLQDWNTPLFEMQKTELKKEQTKT